jgi:hypothetical protein
MSDFLVAVDKKVARLKAKTHGQNLGKAERLQVKFQSQILRSAQDDKALKE